VVLLKSKRGKISVEVSCVRQGSQEREREREREKQKFNASPKTFTSFELLVMKG